ncbi:MAG: CorA family divalent cation transporter [Bdellovibrionota bacterium]|nr:CorA family divalent cation transporter [Bdellovibrionota bacterium]
MDFHATLSEKLGEYYEEVEELVKDRKALSVFEDYDDFQVLVVRGILLTSSGLSFDSRSYIIVDDKYYFVSNQNNKLSLKEENLDNFLKALTKTYRNNRKILDIFFEHIEVLETQVYDRTVSSIFMDTWARIKRDLSKLESYYFRNLNVYREFFRNQEPKFNILKDQFKDIEESIGYQQVSVGTLMTQLDSTHNYFSSLKADRLNKTLLGLTVISGIFLPLNLIVGFFGMNTSGLFLANDPQGTTTVVYVLLGVLAVFLLGFKVVQILDLLILRFLLGKSDLYQKLRSRLEDVSKQLKGE